MTNQDLLELLIDYSHKIDLAKSSYHNVNQWYEDIDDGTGESHEERIDLAFKKLENAIKGLKL
jgi:hypothetical protein